MAEQYAFFKLRGLDWSAATARARAKLPLARSAREFYDVLEEMVGPLEDRHTDVTATDLNLRLRHHRRSGGALDPALFNRVKANPPRRYLAGPLESWCQDWVQFGELSGSIGYLRILREYSYTPSGRFEDDSLALIRALDSIMPRAARLRGLVVDLRMNGGGFDAIALLIASRLTGSSYHAFGKQTRSDPVHPDRFTPLQAVHVRPSPGARYTGPVVLLTGPYTLSAGEVLTLSLLGRRPAITRIGEATQGIFADELLRRLPNGWRFQLSTERYLTPAGENFEGRGIPPHRTVAVFPPTDLESGRDGALELALQILRP
jgi:C-terminal processing protease CtpA/Prc